jgi:molybdate-binding protein/transcriptional regulator with XRE-family HTH domain
MSDPATGKEGSHLGSARVRDRRSQRGWTQSELARRAGVSRAAVSAIETNRLVPSVSAALKLAACLECTVEELFGRAPAGSPPTWAWSEPASACRYWRADVAGRLLFFPAEETLAGVVAHDGVSSDQRDHTRSDADPSRTLILAGCDPAGGLLAAEYARQTGFRMIVLGRSSAAALELLARGCVHVAGAHLAAAGERRGNAAIVRRKLGQSAGLLRLARWEEGVALSKAASPSTISGALRSRLSWVGREPGSGARRCMDQLLGDRRRPSRIARDHRGVAYAIRSGWADAGVCLRLASEEAGLQFLSVQREDYDLCFARASESDPRLQALIRVVRSPGYRRLLADLPGYDVSETGSLDWTKGSSARGKRPR